MHHLRQSKCWHLKGKPVVTFSKWLFFSKFFVDVMTHIIRDNAAKRIKLFFELFINKNYEFIFVSFSSSQLYYLWKKFKKTIKEYLYPLISEHFCLSRFTLCLMTCSSLQHIWPSSRHLAPWAELFREFRTSSAPNSFIPFLSLLSKHSFGSFLAHLEEKYLLVYGSNTI